ncbi:MAG: hypothetical protein ACREBE_04605, partial [bacterium]
FQGSVGFERGVSGGPVYDAELRQVVGMLRAVEGDNLAYVIPMHEVFAGWADLEALNRRGVRDEPLDQLAQDFGIRPIADGASPRGTALRRNFDRMLGTYTVFGGRQRELDALRGFLADERTAGDHYMFVTGTSGFGKTALLVQCIRTMLLERGESAFHFITPRVAGASGVSEEFCLENLCEQLMACHLLGGSLPQQVLRLRPLYVDLLRLAPMPGRRVVVVLDGLDEALGRWDVSPDLFPQELPDGVHVIFSAREIANRDWLADLGLTLPRERVLTLGQLDERDIHGVVMAAWPELPGGVSPEALVRRLHELSRGDPFYLHDLLVDVTSVANGVEQLEDHPIGHNAYLVRWWESASAQSSKQAFVDLMGVLAVARGPLVTRELAELSNDDALAGPTLNNVIKDAERFIVGDREGGYQLSHTRIREFIHEQYLDVIDVYHDRMAAYCLRWTEPALLDRTRDYMLLNAASHLADAHRHADLVTLIDPRWVRAKWQRFGSYAPLIKDLEVSANAFLAGTPPDYVTAATSSLTRQTAREQMLHFPNTLLVAWIRLGEVGRVRALLDALGEAKGRAAEPMVAVADELLRSENESPELASLGADLLSGATALLSSVRASSDRLDLVQGIAACVRADGPLSPERRTSVLSHVEDFVRTIEEPALKASALGVVAKAVMTALDDHAWARRLLDSASETVTRIAYAPDRLVAEAHLLPAVRALAPDRAVAEARRAWESCADPFANASLDKIPVRTLIVEAGLGELEEKADATRLLMEIVDACMERYASGFIIGHAASALVALGQHRDAVKIVERLWEKEPIEGARAVLETAASLHAVDPERTAKWLEMSEP